MVRFEGRIKSEGIDRRSDRGGGSTPPPGVQRRWGKDTGSARPGFAESSGKEANIFSLCRRYRDYVIDAVNADMLFDRFLVEQIAGDLLPSDSDKERARLLIATGYLAGLAPRISTNRTKVQFAAGSRR